MTTRPPLHFTPLYPEHLLHLKIHPVQTDEYNAMLAQASLNALEHCTGVTAWAGDHPVGIAGVFPIWQDRAEAWVLVSKEMGYYLNLVYTKIQFVLDTVPFRRVEMCVKVDNNHGHKLARLFGFGGPLKVTLPNGKVVDADGLMQAYWPTGCKDVVMYSRIREP